MKKIYIIICILPLLFLACTKTQNSSVVVNDNDLSLAKVIINGRLRVGVDPSYPPMCFYDTRGMMAGVDIDILTAVADFMDTDIEFVEVDWSKKFENLYANEIDCIASGFSTSPERNKIIMPTLSYFKNPQVILVRNSESIKKLSDLKGKKCGTQENSTGMDMVNEKCKYLFSSVRGYKRILSAFYDLRNLAIDACILDLPSAMYFISQNPNSFYILPDCLAEDKYVFALRKNEVALKNEIEQALIALDNNGTLEKISYKWFNAQLIRLER